MPITVSIAINGNVVRTMANVPWSSGMNAQNALEQAYATGTDRAFHCSILAFRSVTR